MKTNDEPNAPLRVIIADDHPLVLLAIESLLSALPNMRVVGRAADMTDLLAYAEHADFNLAVIDLHMPNDHKADGLDAVRQFRARHPGVTLVVLTMETEADALQQVLALGVDALLSKRDRIDLIHVAIVTALAEERYIGPAVRKLIAETTQVRRLEFVRALLSPRELEVLTHYAAGVGVTEIALRLGRSVKTVSAQKCAAMRKLALHSDSDLFRFATDHGLLKNLGMETQLALT